MSYTCEQCQDTGRIIIHTDVTTKEEICQCSKLNVYQCLKHSRYVQFSGKTPADCPACQLQAQVDRLAAEVRFHLKQQRSLTQQSDEKRQKRLESTGDLPGGTLGAPAPA